MSGIHGQVLEVTVVGCTRLKDTEWFSRQDPYVCLEYAGAKVRTSTCTDGGRNPIFQQKFMYSLIEGLREINVFVWNSNTINHDYFIGSGKVLLQKVLSQGFDDCSWQLQTKSGRYAGEVHLTMFYQNANRSNYAASPSATPLPPRAPPTRHHSFPFPFPNPMDYPPPVPPPPYQHAPPSPAFYHYPAPGYYHGSGVYPPPPPPY